MENKATWRRSSSENIHFNTYRIFLKVPRQIGRKSVLQEAKCEKTFVENQMGRSQCDSFPDESHHVESEIQFDVPKSTSQTNNKWSEEKFNLLFVHIFQLELGKKST